MKNTDYSKMDKLREFSSYPSQSLISDTELTSQSQMNLKVEQLHIAAAKFASLSTEQRIELAQAMQRGYIQIAERSIHAACEAKGIALGSTLEAEEWATGPWGIVRQLRLIIEALHSIQKHGNTPIGKISRTESGNLAVNVFPANAIDGMLFKDVTVEVYMKPYVTESSIKNDRASFYKKNTHPERSHQGKVVLVLGAGNIAAIGIMDVLTKMFNEGKVCILKMNPVNAYLGPLIEEAFKTAIDQHYLAVIYGGAEVGRHLVYHTDIDEVHLTGSDKTHDQIVWGSLGPEQLDRRKNSEPLLKKTITSELGNISPIIVVPGPYSDKEITFQADAISAAFTMNASYLCNSAKMMVMPKNWDGSARFMQAIQHECKNIAPRKAYYPGAEDRWQALTNHRKNVLNIGNASAGTLPWTFITGLDSENDDELLFHEEPFCSVLSEVQLGGPDPVAFLDKAVEFCNNKLWGTLSATLIVHPKSLKDPATKAAVERAISKLKYGTVAVNTFPGLSFVFASSPWGAYPGSTSDNIQSGSGFVHNTAMLEGIEKAVIRAPLTCFPKPAFFPTHRQAHLVVKRIVAMEENASWAKVPGIVWAAMRG